MVHVSLSNSRFRLLALAVDAAILFTTALVSSLYWASVVLGVIFGACGLVADYVSPKMRNIGASGWALTLGGGVLLAMDHFHPIRSTEAHSGWVMVLQYMAAVWISWGFLMFLLPAQKSPR